MEPECSDVTYISANAMLLGVPLFPKGFYCSDYDKFVYKETVTLRVLLMYSTVYWN